MRFTFLSNRIFWLNFSFWLLFFSYKFYDFTVFMAPEVAFARIGLPMFFHIILSYTHYFFILPPLLRTKKLFQYLGRLIPVIAVVMFFQVLAENQVLSQYSQSDYYEHFGWVRFVSTLWDQMSFMIFTGMIKFAADWFELENKKKELENQKLNAELNYLKAQINPHFLFNTLHNLNYLALAKKDEASEVIVKLSNIMRYMIYDAKKKRVALSKEIAYMRDYLDLEKIRLNNQFSIVLDASRLDDQLEIEPLILIPFLENAFKHGVSDKHPESRVSMELSSEGRQLTMKLSNSVFEKSQSNKDASGFGLENVKQRLELSYPQHHRLVIDSGSDEFKVELNITLS
ncbi:MAG: histidine kinase [Roseivirga sp.]|nr:histidine kinase [Roseivirga sp.]